MIFVTSVRMRVLWNSQQSTKFSPTRGLRQGNPLPPSPPTWFVLCMERLDHIIRDSVEDGNWKPISLHQMGPALSHMFFADDLVLYAECSIQQIENIQHCLRHFVRLQVKR